MASIHPTAIVDSRAELGPEVTIEAYAIVEGRVVIGPGTVIRSHCVINGPTRIGANCRIGPSAYVGLEPQHLRFDGGSTWLVIGDRTLIRENASLHRSTHEGEEHATRVGSDCFLMGGVHVAHDCQVGDRVIMANAVLLGGHCQIGHRAFLGGGCTLHQFVRVGRMAVVSGNEAVTRDVPPFAAARYGALKGYNAIGCRRGGLSQEAIYSIRRAYSLLHGHRTMNAALAAIEAMHPRTAEVGELIEFMRTTQRGIQPSYAFLRNVAACEE